MNVAPSPQTLIYYLYRILKVFKQSKATIRKQLYKQFYEQYISTLQLRREKTNDTREIRVNDIVLVKDEKLALRN